MSLTQEQLDKAFPKPKAMDGDEIERALHQNMVGEHPFEPCYDRMLFQPDPPPSKVRHGGLEIVVPETYRAKTCRGVIKAAGLNARDTMRSHGSIIGDRIFVPRYSGVLFPWRGIEVVVMPCKDIMCNFDLAERIDKGLMVYAFNEAKSEHFVKWRDESAEQEWSDIMKARNEGGKAHG